MLLLPLDKRGEETAAPVRPSHLSLIEPIHVVAGREQGNPHGGPRCDEAGERNRQLDRKKERTRLPPFLFSSQQKSKRNEK